MLTNTSENEKLFAKYVPVSLKDLNPEQLRPAHLFLTLEWQTSSSLFGSKVLAISLTDNHDPFFLYTLHLSAEDFQILRNTLELKVDFAAFPQFMINYVEKCLHEEKNPQPKYFLMFSANDKLGNAASSPELHIIERTEFRNLTHLFVKFVPASESAVKQYLVSSFRKLRDEKHQLQNRLACLEQDSINKRASYEQVLNTKIQELELLKEKSYAELSKKENQYSRELQEERSKHQISLREIEDKFEAELREKEQYFSKEMKQLQTKISSLESLKKELQAKNKRQDSTLREQETNNKSLEDEIRRLRDSSESYKQKCDVLNLDNKNKEACIRQLDNEIHDLKNELQSRRQAITRLKEQIESDLKDRQRLQIDLENAKVQHEMSETANQYLKKEIDEQNEVIIKLQKKVKDANEKVKAKSELCAKLGKEIKEKNEISNVLHAEVKEIKILLEAKDNELRTLKDSLSYDRTRLQELEEMNRHRDNVIKYLNSQLSEKHILPLYNGSTNFQPSPTAVAEKHLNEIRSRNSLSSPDSSPVNAVNAAVSKTVRYATPPGGKSTFSPYGHQVTGGTDSAYCTDPSSNKTNFTPDNPRDHCANPEKPEIDPAALSAVFGDSTPKTSTAKKKTDSAKRQLQTPAPLKSSVSRIARKR